MQLHFNFNYPTKEGRYLIGEDEYELIITKGLRKTGKVVWREIDIYKHPNKGLCVWIDDYSNSTYSIFEESHIKIKDISNQIYFGERIGECSNN